MLSVYCYNFSPAMLQLNSSLREAVERRDSTDSILRRFKEEYKGVRADTGPYDQLNHLKLLLLNQAIQNDYIDLTERLVRSGELDLAAIHGHSYTTPLALACYLKKPPELVQLLIKHGADIQHIGGVLNYESPRTAFCFVMKHDEFQYIEPLLNVYHKSRDENLRSPIIIACQENAFNCLEQLIRRDPCSVHSKDLLGRTPLLHASTKGLKFLRLLIDNGADIKHIDLNKRGVLHHLFCNENYDYPFCLAKNTADIVKYLIEKGAVINIVDNQGQSPVMFLCSHVKLSIEAVHPIKDMPYNVEINNQIVKDCIAVLGASGQDLNLDTDRTPLAIVIHQVRGGVSNCLRMVRWDNNETMNGARDALDTQLKFVRDLIVMLLQLGAQTEYTKHASMSLLTQLAHTLQFPNKCPQEVQEMIAEHLFDIISVLLINGAKTFMPICNAYMEHDYCSSLFIAILNSLGPKEHCIMLEKLKQHCCDRQLCAADGVHQLIEYQSINPRDLKIIARLAINKRLNGVEKSRQVSQLPLPKPLLDYIKR